MPPVLSLQAFPRLALFQSSQYPILSSSTTACLYLKTRLVARHGPSERPFSSSQTARTPSPPQTPPKREGPKISDMVRELKAKDTPRREQSSSDAMDALMLRNPQSRTIGAFTDVMASRSSPGWVDSIAAEVRSTSSIALRLRPTLGRTVTGIYGDPNRAFRMLERKCAENRVRGDARAQMFHVRKGQARKDIARLRWRSLFKEGFVAECDRIRRMRKQGW